MVGIEDRFVSEGGLNLERHDDTETTCLSQKRGAGRGLAKALADQSKAGRKMDDKDWSEIWASDKKQTFNAK